jgi:hypothetical protein
MISSYLHLGCFTPHFSLSLVQVAASETCFLDDAWSAAMPSGSPDAALRSERFRLNKRQPEAMLWLGERFLPVAGLVSGANLAKRQKQQAATESKECQGKQAGI